MVTSEASDLTTTVLEHVLSVHGAEIGIRAGTSSELLTEDFTVSPVS